MSGTAPGVADRGALASYGRALRTHALLAGALFLLVVGAGIAWSFVRTRSYQATARILVTPLAQDNTTFIGLPLIRDTGDPTRTMQTVAALIDSAPAAQLTASVIGTGWSAARVQSSVNVQPEGQSDILDVTAHATNAQLAARLSNSFATSALSVRSQELRQLVAQAITYTRAQLAHIRSPTSVAAADLQDRLSQLQSLGGGRDPTISLSEGALPPRSPSGLTTPLILLLALLAGTVLASGVALLIELVRKQRILTEEQLLALMPGAVLARIPIMARRLRRVDAGGLVPLPPAVSETLRSVRIQLDLLPGRHRTILITSASHGDGKTTTVVNLARELASSGARVMIIDADLRKPDIGGRFGAEPVLDLANALESMEPSWVSEQVDGPALRVVPAWPDHEFVTLNRVAHALERFLKLALQTVDYVLLDAPPLGEVADVLRFISAVDDVLLVSRLGHTTVGSFEVTAELLDRVGKRPTGHVIIGSSPRHAPAYGYYYQGKAGSENGSSAPSRGPGTDVGLPNPPRMPSVSPPR